MATEQVFAYCACCNYLEPVAVADFKRDDSDTPEPLCAECAETLGVI